jgi:hypothetical protein
VGCSVCLHDPGFGVDAIITTDARTLYKMWMGQLAPATALRSGALAFDGPPAITRRLVDVLTIPTADVMGTGDDAPRPRLYQSAPPGVAADR